MGQHAEEQKRLEELMAKDSQWIHKGRFISVRQDKLTFPEGRQQTWDIITHPGAAAIAALTSEKEIILVEQYRRAIEKTTIELPAGLLDPGESPEACASRELQEETGFKAHQLTLLGTYYSSPSIFTEKIYLFLGQGLEPSRLLGEDTHEIDVIKVSLKKALNWVLDGTIFDAKTAIGIFKLSHLCDF
jgi:ADP-ribose pyrophosphatase